jgi:hypothetical protein
MARSNRPRLTVGVNQVIMLTLNMGINAWARRRKSELGLDAARQL